MSPRTFLIAAPAIFAASLGLGYGFAPRAKQPSQAHSSTVVPSSPRTDDRPSIDRQVVEEKPVDAAQISQSSQTPATAEDVFNALGSVMYSERAFRVQQAVDRLDVTQAEAVLEQVDSIGRFDQAHVIPRVISRLMDIAPERALNWLETNAPTFREGSSTFVLAFEMACKKDPDGARRVFDSVAEGDRRNALGEVMIRYMAMKDPAAAYAFLQTFPKGAARDKLALGYVNGLAASNPTSAITQALKWKEGATRKTTLATAFITLARGGQGQALAALDQVKNASERGYILGRLASRARQNEVPALAAYYESAVRENPGVAESFSGVERLADGFTRANPSEAIEWAKRLPGKQRGEALSTALSVWGWEQPEAAIAWVQQNSSNTEERQQHLQEIYRGWVKSDLSKALAWAEKLPPGTERDRSTAIIVSQYATKGQHNEALEWLQRLPAKEQSDLAMRVAGRLAWDDPPVASRWLGNIEPDENSAHLFGRVASEWAEKDFKAAAAWLGSIPAGVCRDQAVVAYANQVAGLDPAAAVEWAASTSNEVTRVRMIEEVLLEWRERDPRAAAQWLESTTALSAERKASLKGALR
jgi:hypothetical protein